MCFAAHTGRRVRGGGYDETWIYTGGVANVTTWRERAAAGARRRTGARPRPDGWEGSVRSGAAGSVPLAGYFSSSILPLPQGWMCWSVCIDEVNVHQWRCMNGHAPHGGACTRMLLGARSSALAAANAKW